MSVLQGAFFNVLSEQEKNMSDMQKTKTENAGQTGFPRTRFTLMII